MSPPRFASVPGDYHAAAEFKAFVDAAREPAVFLLGELSEIHNLGSEANMPLADKNATQVRDLCCRAVGTWSVYYTCRRNPFQIFILHVGNRAVTTSDVLENEATRRLMRL